MDMKKVLAVISLLGLFGAAFLTPAYAGWWGRGGKDCASGGPGAGCGKGPCFSRDKGDDLDKARQEFRGQSQELRQQLHGKKGLYRELMQQDVPNKDEAAKLWSEIFDLQLKLQQMKATAGIAAGRNCGCDAGDDADNQAGPGCGHGPRGGRCFDGDGASDCQANPGCGHGPRGGCGRGCNGPK